MVNYFYLSTFAVYLVIVLGIGAWGYTNTSDADDFWVFGRNLGPWLATWSLVANFISAASIIGFVGAIYTEGYTFLTSTIFGLVLGVSLLYFAVGKVRRLDVMTLPDIVAEFTGREWSRPIAAMVLLANAWIYLIMQLVGASLLVTTVTGVPYRYMIWVIGFVFIAYTVLGGLVSVAWTDLIQGTIMAGTILLALGFLVADIGGIVELNTQLVSIDSAMIAPLGEGAYTLLGIIGGLVAFAGTVLTEQNYIIRISATKDVKTAKIHVAAAGVILSILYIALVVLGGATRVALQNSGLAVDNVDKAFPVLIMDYLPTTIGVVLILAIMSAILSTTDTRLHSTGVTTSHDLYEYFASNPSEEKQLKVSRYATIFFGITATAIAVDPPGTIITLYDFRAVLLTSAFLIPVYVTLYHRGLDGRAVLLSMILGVIFGVSWQLGFGFIELPPTIVGVGMACLGLLGGSIVWSGDRIISPTN